MRRLVFTCFCLVWVLLPWAAASAAEPGTTPDYVATDLDGNAHSAASLRGKVVLVEFWATWCSPCKESLPFYAQLVRENPDELVVLAVSIDARREDARDFLKKVVPDFEALPGFVPIWSAKHSLAALFGPTVFPTAYFLDRQGVVREVVVGFDQASRARSQAVMKKLVAPGEAQPANTVKK